MRCGEGVVVVVVSIGLAILQGCGSQIDDVGSEMATRTEALNARVSYGALCTPFAALQFQRGAFYARTVAASNAFQRCLRNSMWDEYTPVSGDPNADLGPGQRIEAVVRMYTDFNNHVAVECNNDGEIKASAPIGSYGSYENRIVKLGIGGSADVAPGGYHEAEGDWGSYSQYSPWQYRVGDLIHEFAHSHGYRHVDGNRGVPYIADYCAAAVVTQSYAQCGQATGLPACAGTYLYLLNSWTGTIDTPQPAGTCECSSDPLRLVSFRRPQDGRRLSAIDGGGREIRTNETISLGPWQTFFLINNQRGDADPASTDRARWWLMDYVQIKAFGGSWMTSDFNATGSRPTMLQVGYSEPERPVHSGDLVRIRWRDANGLYRYASDNGTQLTGTNLLPGPDEEFYVDIYRRDTMVYLRTNQNAGLVVGVDGRYVEGGDDRRLYSGTTDLHLNTDDKFDSKRRSAFWLIDWNGSQLRSGDSVSLEQFRDESWHYWSSSGVGVGQMWLRHSAGPDERFTITKVSGSTGPVIGHNDVITLRTSAGRYVTAGPAPGGFAITAGGVDPGTYQRFKLSMVQHHDRVRPTW